MRKNNKHYLKFLFVLFALFCFVDLSAKRIIPYKKAQVHSLPNRGRVIEVFDGDTVQVRFRDRQVLKVRLIGVDAPEITSGREEVKFRAQMAKKFAFFHLYRKKIRLSFETELVDSYGRILAYIWTEEQGLFNKFIISEGFASSFTSFPFQYRNEFRKAEQEARKLEKGLWKRGGYTRIPVEKAKDFIGQLVTVEFMCSRVLPKGNFIVMNTFKGEFSVLVPKENRSLFPELKNFRGKDLSVTGFLEEYKKKPQVVAFYPDQIKKEVSE